jgi:hypothetical protein
VVSEKKDKYIIIGVVSLLYGYLLTHFTVALKNKLKQFSVAYKQAILIIPL